VEPGKRRGFAAIAGTVILAGAGLWRFAPDRRDSLLPSIRKVVLISDRQAGGGSDIVLEQAGREIRFRYGLVPGSGHPWAGVNLQLTDSVSRPIDAGEWSGLEVLARSSRGLGLRIQLLSDDALPGSEGKRDSLRPIYHALEFVPDGTRSAFPWTAFSVPSWWRSQHGRSETQRLDLLDRLRAIEFQSGDSPGGRDSSAVEILELDLVGPNRIARNLGVFLMLSGAVGLGWLFLRRGPGPGIGSQSGSFAALVPDPVILDDPRSRQREQLVLALREKFPDPDLSLDSFAASQGLSPRLVAGLIKEATQLHFKGALNELRLTEAARLLKETRGNVSEIAYAVGFQNPSHFGRAFREKHGVSPTDYRAGGKSPGPEDPTLQN